MHASGTHAQLSYDDIYAKFFRLLGMDEHGPTASGTSAPVAAVNASGTHAQLSNDGLAVEATVADLVGTGKRGPTASGCSVHVGAHLVSQRHCENPDDQNLPRVVPRITPSRWTGSVQLSLLLFPGSGSDLKLGVPSSQHHVADRCSGILLHRQGVWGLPEWDYLNGRTGDNPGG